MRLKEDYIDYMKNPEVIAKVDSILNSFNNLEAVDYAEEEEDFGDRWNFNIKCVIPYVYNTYTGQAKDVFEFWVDVHTNDLDHVDLFRFNESIWDPDVKKSLVDKWVEILFKIKVRESKYYQKYLLNVVGDYFDNEVNA